MSAKGEYHTLLALGDLLDIYPELTGDWELDKTTFTSLWEDNKEMFAKNNLSYEELGGPD